jgi:hypothetical protein
LKPQVQALTQHIEGLSDHWLRVLVHPGSIHKPSGLVRAATTYTKGPVNSPGTYTTRFDDDLRFFYATTSTFNTSSINKAALKLTAKPTTGTLSHDAGNYYVTPARGKSFFVMWNNVTANRYDWLALKYLGNGRFATLDHFGNSTNLDNGAGLTRTYTSGGSMITLRFSNPSGSGWYANDATYSFSFSNS